MPKLALIGAGSTVFAKDLIADLLRYPDLEPLRFALHDIDEERLRTSETVARRVSRELGRACDIEATTELERALDGANYVMTMFQVAGYRPGTVTDFEIPKRYGLRQTIGDTLGIGGIMRALRTIPVLLDVCLAMEAHCPDALLLNYVNPMAMNCRAVHAAAKVRVVGLCHSVPHTARALAADLGEPFDRLRYQVAGINHVAFFLRLESNGADLLPRLRKLAEEGPVRPDDRVRYAVLRELGYFVTESSEHFAEYVPWFIKRGRPDLIERYGVPLDEYLRRSEALIQRWSTVRDELAHGPESILPERTDDFGPVIVHAIETGTPSTVYGNVRNDGAIVGLPDDACVEVPCLVDGSGVQPTRVGRLPTQLTAVIRSQISVQELAVEAALSGDRTRVRQAAMMDPHTAAELDLEQIRALVDDLLEAHATWLPQFAGDGGAEAASEARHAGG